MSAGKHAELCKNPHAWQDDKCYYRGGRKTIRALQLCLAGQSGTASEDCPCEGPAHWDVGKVCVLPQITDPVSLGWGYLLRLMNLHTHPHHKQSFFPPPAQITVPQEMKTAKPLQLITHMQFILLQLFFPLRELNLSSSHPTHMDHLSCKPFSHHYTGFFLQGSFLLHPWACRKSEYIA